MILNKGELNMSVKYFVVIADESGNEESRMGPFKSLRKAETVESGANINLDHWNYHTSIESSWD